MLTFLRAPGGVRQFAAGPIVLVLWLQALAPIAPVDHGRCPFCCTATPVSPPAGASIARRLVWVPVAWPILSSRDGRGFSRATAPARGPPHRV